jgi:hypothetical protein
MATLTLAFTNGLNQVVAQGVLIIDRKFVPGVMNLLWHLDPNQDHDLFDTSGVTFEQATPHGWGFWTSDNTLTILLGPEQKSLTWFAHIFHVLQHYDEEEEILKSGTAGQGWLFRGRRVPSGQITWTVTE